MTILYVIKYIAQLGGLDRVMTYKMNWLAQHGYEVHLVTYEQGDHPLSFQLDARIRHTDIGVKLWKKQGRTLPARLRSYFCLRRQFVRQLTAEVLRIDPDVMVTLTDSYQVTDLLMSIPTRARRIVESHVERKAFMKTGDFEGRPLMKWIAGFYDRRMARYLHRADALVLLTRQDKAQWPDVPQSVVIPNPITFWPEQVSRLDNPIVMAAGRLHAQKGFDLLIEAWKHVHAAFPGWQLHIYGDGPDRDMLQRQINEAGLADTISLVPATPDIFEAYREASIFCLSSRYEGYGLVLAEAMSTGVPCVSFNCPYGPADIISDGLDGILVPPMDVKALADGIVRLIDNPALCLQLGTAARQHIARYAPEAIMPQWERLFAGGLSE